MAVAISTTGTLLRRSGKGFMLGAWFPDDLAVCARVDPQ